MLSDHGFCYNFAPETLQQRLDRQERNLRHEIADLERRLKLAREELGRIR